MKELVSLALRLNLRAICIEPSSNVTIQAFRAFFVGGIAFIVDASILWILSLLGMHYLISAIFGFMAGLIINFLLSIKYVFREKAPIGRFGEITVYSIISLTGLWLTELSMWLLTDIVGLYFMASKCIAALYVFLWNFIARKFILYRKG